MAPARVVVVGGGVCGSAAALHLARSGHEVVLLERAPNLGGLVVSFSVGGTPLEGFYHHVFPHEREIISLIGELGLGSRFAFHRSSVGVLSQGRVWPFTSPLDLLRFGPLPVIDRVRTGIGSWRLARAGDLDALETITARDWLTRATTPAATKVLWDELLRFKFGASSEDVPASWMAARFRQRSGARVRGRERLGYLHGGFKLLFDSLHAELCRLGAEVRVGASVDNILLDGAKAHGVASGTEQLEADAVLYAGTLPGLGRLLPTASHDPRWSAIGSLGAVCVVVELSRPVSNVYWTNVCDPDIPFGGLIEHTNLVGHEQYGSRIAYLGRYFTQDDPVASVELDKLASVWVDALADGLPSFRPGDVVAAHPFRTSYAAPLVTMGYRDMIPPVRSHIEGLFVATTAQIYPEDRGMSEGVKLGVAAAEEIAS